MAPKIRLILASASPRRRELLRSLCIPFSIKVSHVSEASTLRRPIPLVRALALRKARAVARTLRYGWVLGADTVVVLRGKILGKPRDNKHAAQMLGNLSGSTHAVYTGIAIVEAPAGKEWIAHEKSIVRMKRIPPEKLHKLSHQHLDKAGSYAIQERKDPIARVVNGSYDNVVGLPLKSVKALLKKLSQDA